MVRTKRTKTSSFGVSGRVSHDSSPFYSRKLYSDFEAPTPTPSDLAINSVPSQFLDKILYGDARDILKKLPNNCVHLMVTSPPYNVGKEYDNDLTLEQYIDFLGEVLREVYRVLVWGGRVCFNVANLGRKPYISLHKYIIELFENLGFLMRGEIIWHKGDKVADSSTAWGTWKSPINPTLRDVHEYILVFSKGSLSRNDRGESTIMDKEFLEFTKSVWVFPPESASRLGHPAPFPIDLPYRCIQLYTFKGDVVLDPFVGSGTTAVAALLTNRHYIGIDINEEYVRLAEERLKKVKTEINSSLVLSEFLRDDAKDLKDKRIDEFLK